MKDITPAERELLSRVLKRPGMFLGKKELRRFELWAYGYNEALRETGLVGERVWLPFDELNKCASAKYGDDRTLNCAGMILERVPDDGRAFDAFFEMLNEVLVSNGFQPIL